MKGLKPFPDCEGELWKRNGFASPKYWQAWEASVKHLEASMDWILEYFEGRA
jgi:hypothetical protein